MNSRKPHLYLYTMFSVIMPIVTFFSFSDLLQKSKNILVRRNYREFVSLMLFLEVLIKVRNLCLRFTEHARSFPFLNRVQTRFGNRGWDEIALPLTRHRSSLITRYYLCTYDSMTPPGEGNVSNI